MYCAVAPAKTKLCTVLFPLLRQGDSYWYSFLNFEMGNKKTRLRGKNHTASNASKALLEVLTARGQEIKFGRNFQLAELKSWF